MNTAEIVSALTKNHRELLTGRNRYEVLADAAKIASAVSGRTIEHTLVSDQVLPELTQVVQLSKECQRTSPTLETAVMINYYEQQITLSQSVHNAYANAAIGTSNRVIWTRTKGGA